jgi:hypothetical protein
VGLIHGSAHAFLAFGSTAAGMLLWNLAVSRLPGSRVSLLLYLEPLVSVVGAVSLLHEHASGAMIIGGVLVLAGVGASWAPARDRRRRARAAPTPVAGSTPLRPPPPGAAIRPDGRPLYGFRTFPCALSRGSMCRPRP